jgi:integrase
MESRLNLKKKDIADLPIPPTGRRAEYYDTQVRGLMVRVTDTGKKAFYVRRKKDGVSQRVLIGPYPDIPLEEARKRALELCSAFARGENPQEKKKQIADEPTFGDLLDTYLKEYAEQRCLAAKEIAAVFRRYLSDWRRRKLHAITKAEVHSRVNQIGRENGTVAANHTITYARAAVNWCIKNGYCNGENPWASVPKFKTQARERFLKPEEIGRFFAALKEMDNDAGFRDYIYLSLFTGARRGNVMSMRWDQIDFDLGTWTIPRTKSGDSQIIPLTQAALQILTERQEKKTSNWVFPGVGDTGHIVEPKKAWHGLLKEAKIEDLRLHDLRRTLGSYMAMGNQSLHMIGKVLGHKSPAATQIYSRFAHDPIRAALEKAHADMLEASVGNGKLPSRES